MEPHELIRTLLLTYQKKEGGITDVIESHLDYQLQTELVEHIKRLNEKSMNQKLITEQAAIIYKLREMVDHLQEEVANIMLHWRSLDPLKHDICGDCGGSGTIAPAEMIEIHNGGIEVFMPTPCSTCWGSGDQRNPWNPPKNFIH